MLRHLLLSVFLGTMLALAGGGCRSCSSCHDYDGPVADCNNCGSGRTAVSEHGPLGDNRLRPNGLREQLRR